MSTKQAWCERCDESIELSEERRDDQGVAHCPKCDAVVVEEDEEEHVRAPWHFKVLLLGTVGYLIYRLIWFIFWLRQHA